MNKRLRKYNVSVALRYKTTQSSSHGSLHLGTETEQLPHRCVLASVEVLDFISWILPWINKSQISDQIVQPCSWNCNCSKPRSDGILCMNLPGSDQSPLSRGDWCTPHLPSPFIPSPMYIQLTARSFQSNLQAP